ncbi:hypothetical protein Barb4_01700 [Bacteroidales bacterium Barb4]|nr:hypothetical protein Barb4_01700 [Bacteroidales bacterium Barb4]
MRDAKGGTGQEQQGGEVEQERSGRGSHLFVSDNENVFAGLFHQVFFTGEVFQTLLVGVQIVQPSAVRLYFLLVVFNFFFEAADLLFVGETAVQTAVACRKGEEYERERDYLVGICPKEVFVVKCFEV